MQKAWEYFLDILFPPRCGVCKKYTKQNTGLCKTCIAVMPQHDSLFCGNCYARLPAGKKICHKRTPYILGAASSYSDPTTRAAIQSLKFERIHAVAKPLGHILASYWQHLKDAPQNATVIPVPLSRRRRWERGFNQSVLIAQHFCRHTDLQLNTDLLARTRHRKPQMQLPRAERKENIAGCFSIAEKADVPKAVVLVDDVTTTGATFAEAARTLKDAGVKKVIALAVARA